MEVKYEPKILGFLCNWCGYAGADMAGTGRMSYPANIRIIRVPCSGRVDPLFIIKGFQQGADGILVVGCHPGDCHYKEGNYHTRRRMSVLRPFLDFMGIEEDRLRLEWVSASEGKKFSKLVQEFTEKVRHLGPVSNQRARHAVPSMSVINNI